MNFKNQIITVHVDFLPTLKSSVVIIKLVIAMLFLIEVRQKIKNEVQKMMKKRTFCFYAGLILTPTLKDLKALFAWMFLVLFPIATEVYISIILSSKLIKPQLILMYGANGTLSIIMVVTWILLSKKAKPQSTAVSRVLPCTLWVSALLAQVWFYNYISSR